MLKLCDDIDTMAMTLLDGELAEQELRDMDLHLLGCASCKAHVERERASHQLRRQRLAAPPAPALLRARIARALDEVDRARRPAARSYFLPAGAVLAAVAALVVFVASARTGGTAAPRNVAIKVPETVQLDKQHVAAGTLPRGYTLSDLQIRHHGTELLGSDVASLDYAILTPDGAQLDVNALVIDAARMKTEGPSREIGGYPVWSDPHSGVYVVDGTRGILLRSGTITPDDIEVLISATPLVARIGADDPRK